ncbi:transposase family protein [Streptomyces sp. NBC_00233]|nr:transposase family protein [Streptomyces sp. NBC_00233]
MRLRDPGRGRQSPRRQRADRGVLDGTEIRIRRLAAGRKDRDTFISGKNKQNAVQSMVVTYGEGRVPWCGSTKPGRCADIIQACQLGLVTLLADGPVAEILADVGYRASSDDHGESSRVSTWRRARAIGSPHNFRADVIRGGGKRG